MLGRLHGSRPPPARGRWHRRPSHPGHSPFPWQGAAGRNLEVLGCCPEVQPRTLNPPSGTLQKPLRHSPFCSQHPCCRKVLSSVDQRPRGQPTERPLTEPYLAQRTRSTPATKLFSCGRAGVNVNTRRLGRDCLQQGRPRKHRVTPSPAQAPRGRNPASPAPRAGKCVLIPVCCPPPSVCTCQRHPEVLREAKRGPSQPEEPTAR